MPPTAVTAAERQSANGRQSTASAQNFKERNEGTASGSGTSTSPSGTGSATRMSPEGSASAAKPSGETRRESAGTASTDAKPGEVRTTVRLEAEQTRRDGRWETTRIVATGVEQTKDGAFVGERFKSTPILDRQGRAITDPAQAQVRAKEMVENGAISMLTDDQRATANDFNARRTEAVRDLASRLPEKTELRSSLVEPRPAGRPDQPNLFLSGQEAPGVERWSLFPKGESETRDGSPRFNAMIVPNFVGEIGFKTLPGSRQVVPFKGTIQPVTGFFPVTSGLGDAFRSGSNWQAVLQRISHPAGFYPGDKVHPMDPSREDARPGDIGPRFTQEEAFGKRENSMRGFQQHYLNCSDVRNAATCSLNYRAVAGREETLAFAAQSNSITGDGTNVTGTFLAPYSWTQLHSKVGVGLGGLSTHQGIQFEGGVYAFNYGVSVPQVLGQRPKSPGDWHIFNGKVEEGREGFSEQFRPLQIDSGLRLRSQSVVPTAGDNTAPVWLRVPYDVALNYGNTRQGRERPLPNGAEQTTQPGRTDFNAYAPGTSWGDRIEQFFGRDTRRISAESLSAILTEVGARNPQYRELQYVTPETLRKLNPGQFSEFVDPATGKPGLGVRAGTWINTGLKVSEGGPGLYVNPANLPQGYVTEDRRVADQPPVLPHWIDHRDPRGVPAHANTPNRPLSGENRGR